MDDQVLKELKIQNLLSVIDILARSGSSINGTKSEKVLKYIYEREMSDLQFDVALFPRKTETKDYKFHDI